MKAKALVLFEKRETLSTWFHNKAGAMVRRRVTFGAWLDPERLNDLALKASRNKSGRATDGALHVEIHGMEEIS